MLSTEYEEVIKSGNNPWQLPILYDFETDRVVHNASMMSDEIFQANRPKDILLERDKECFNILQNGFTTNYIETN